MASLPVSFVFILLWLTVAMVAFVVECVLYFGLVGAYFRFGPALRRQVWQSNVAVSTAVPTLERAVGLAKLAYRRQSRENVIFISARKGAMRFSMWPRISLRVEHDPHTDAATIICETRPFLSLLLFIPPFLFLPGSTVLVGGVIILLVVIGYIGFWLWELRLRNLDVVRLNLGDIGVRVCSRCGYDLRSSPDRCPECGTAIADRR